MKPTRPRCGWLARGCRRWHMAGWAFGGAGSGCHACAGVSTYLSHGPLVVQPGALLLLLPAAAA